MAILYFHIWAIGQWAPSRHIDTGINYRVVNAIDNEIHIHIERNTNRKKIRRFWCVNDACNPHKVDLFLK